MVEYVPFTISLFQQQKGINYFICFAMYTIGSSLEIYCLEKKCVGPTIRQIYLYR